MDFSRFYQTTLGALRRHVGRIINNSCEAEDLAHDAYARVFSAMQVQEIREPRAFLFTTARRLAFNYVKRRRSGPVRYDFAENLEIVEQPGCSIQRTVMAKEEWAHLAEAIQALPEACRIVLMLAKGECLSHADIAERLGISTSAVEKRYAKAIRLLLKERLAREPRLSAEKAFDYTPTPGTEPQPQHAP